MPAPRAAAQLAHAEAAQRFEEALEALDARALTRSPGRCAGCCSHAARATRARATSTAAASAFATAASVAAAEGDGADFTRAALGYAEWADYGVVDREAIELLEEALARLPRSRPPRCARSSSGGSRCGSRPRRSSRGARS